MSETNEITLAKLAEKIERIEAMLGSLIEVASDNMEYGESGEVPVPLPEDTGIGIVQSPDAPDEIAQSYGALTSHRIKTIAENYKRTTGEEAPMYFLPDLDGFNSNQHYRTVIDNTPGLTPFQKATYLFTLEGAGMMAAFLGTRREYHASIVVPANDPQGRGRIEYGYRATGKKHPNVILVPNVKTVGQAEAWMESWAEGSLDAWRRAKEETGK